MLAVGLLHIYVNLRYPLCAVNLHLINLIKVISTFLHCRISPSLVNYERNRNEVGF